LSEVGGIVRSRPEDVVDRFNSLIETQRHLERQLADAKRALALGGGAAAGDGAAAGQAIKTVGKVRLLARSVQGLNPKDLRGLVDDGKKQVGSGIVAIVGVTEDGKAGLAVGVTEDLLKSWSAVDLVRAGAEALGGKGGGGRPDNGQAGGPHGSQAKDAMKAGEAHLAG
jgi:alanyl-tRNA synthetase